MKKFISVMITVVMLLSLCVVAVHADTSANPIINVYSEKYEVAAGGMYKPGEYDVYRVWYTVEGVDTSVDTIKTAKAGYSISSTDQAKIAAKSFELPVTSGPATKKDYNGILASPTGSTAAVGPIGASSAASAGLDIFDWDTYPDGGTQETFPFIETLVYLTAGESVTYTYSAADSMVTVDTYENDNERVFTSALRIKINGTEGTTLVLGAPAPTYTEIPADTTQAQKVAAPAAKTYKDYDNNDVTLTKNYAIARFVTAIDPAKTYKLHAEATSGSKDFDMDFAGIEVSGTANFITIVKNAPDGTVLTIREQ